MIFRKRLWVWRSGWLRDFCCCIKMVLCALKPTEGEFGMAYCLFAINVLSVKLFSLRAHLCWEITQMALFLQRFGHFLQRSLEMTSCLPSWRTSGPIFPDRWCFAFRSPLIHGENDKMSALSTTVVAKMETKDPIESLARAIKILKGVFKENLTICLTVLIFNHGVSTYFLFNSMQIKF